MTGHNVTGSDDVRTPTDRSGHHAERHRVHLSRHQRLVALWEWPNLIAMLITIPAFYMSLNAEITRWPSALYGICTVVVGLRLVHLLAIAPRSWSQAKHHSLDIWLVCGVLGSAVLPASTASEAALVWRMATAFFILLRIIKLLGGAFTHTGLVRMLTLAAGVLLLCGAGFYWLDPQVNSLEEGLWLAFITAATVGYGDIVPTTTASRIFSVFVVLLGCGMLSLVTASIAAMFVKSQEQQVERDILRELHRELRALREEVAALRNEQRRHFPPHHDES